MKTKLLSAGAGAVAVVASVAIILGDTKPDEAASPEAMTNASEELATVSVDAVAKDPQSHKGTIAVKGVVGKVIADRGALLLIDEAEFAACGTTACAEFTIPILAPNDEFEGELPKEADNVIAVGALEASDKGYRFVVDELRRDGNAIFKRIAPAAAQPEARGNFLPSTLLTRRHSLRLTEEQVTRLAELQTRYAEEQQRLQAKIEHCQAELAELLETEPVDQAKVVHERQEVEGFRAKLAEERRNVEEQARSVLTPDQFKHAP